MGTKFKNSFILLTLLLCYGASPARAQTISYFLPANYSGTGPVVDVTSQADFGPICSAPGGALEGLDLVRAYTGASTCPANSNSGRLTESLNMVLLVDDTQPLSPYLTTMLQQQGALQTVVERPYVRSTRLDIPTGASVYRILIVGEEAYRNGQTAAGWLAALNGVTPNSLVAAGSGGAGSGATNRIDWPTFKNSNQFQQLLSAVRAMRANTTATDPDSWLYWANIHESSCPHSTPYFLAWHRGYLHLFEKKLQALSNNSSFRLPFWDYYSSPDMPTEFTTPTMPNPSGSGTVSNPLYVAGRTNTNVCNALSLAPFSNRLTNFQRGQRNAFEPSIESRPHNQVHNTIGRPFMLGLQSPQDPIFWVHHSNIDRLWVAWVNGGRGRSMPAKSDAYWSGSLVNSRSYNGVNFKYGNLTLARSKTYDTSTDLAYDYSNKRMPTAIPAACNPSTGSRSSPARPPTRGAALEGAPAGTNSVVLAAQSVNLPLSVGSELASTLSSFLESNRDTTELGMEVILSGLELTEAGEQAGFGYHIYLNLPDESSSENAEENHFVGTVGPFEIAGLAHDHEGGHHASELRLMIPDIVLQEGVRDPREITLSFIRVNGEVSPQGEVIKISDVRIEMTRGNTLVPNS